MISTILVIIKAKCGVNIHKDKSKRDDEQNGAKVQALLDGGIFRRI